MDRFRGPLGLPGGGYLRLHAIAVAGRLNGVDDVVSESAEALLLVQLRTSRPDGSRVGERERTCHLVPFSPSEAVPEILTAYCELTIMPGVAESVNQLLGSFCEACVALSPVPVFAMLTQLWNADECSATEPVGQLANRGVG